jgi:hypothetical protein
MVAVLPALAASVLLRARAAGGGESMSHGLARLSGQASLVRRLDSTADQARGGDVS